jgi:predicted cation transporter
MIIGLVTILLLTLFLPLLSKKVEHNLELFLFIVGTSAALISNVLDLDFVLHVLTNKFLYIISAAVLIGGILFRVLNNYIRNLVQVILNRISVRLFVFIVIVLLGFLSSIITAIIAALFLVEIINLLPLSRKKKINIDIIACFSIGLGAALTPIGEPLSTIVVSKLNADFWYMADTIGVYIMPAIIALGFLGAWYAVPEKVQEEAVDKNEKQDDETYKDIFVRTGKIFIFIIALEFLGAGFKPIIDNYVVNLRSEYLYWINIFSAVLDNATLASAEISPAMSVEQIRSILLGLLIAGGMMIPGNIPNIISASKLKIKSSEWISLGVPLGLIIMITYFAILFFI